MNLFAVLVVLALVFGPCEPADAIVAFTTLEVPGATSTSARGNNNLGDVVGHCIDATGEWRISHCLSCGRRAPLAWDGLCALMSRPD